MNPKTFRKFLFFRLPIAFLAGIRLLECTKIKAKTSVRLHKLSQNPFRSIFWAVQGMAAELSTGVLLVNAVQKSKQNVSFLVIEQRAKFHKKATGKIEFSCADGAIVEEMIAKTLATKSGEIRELYSTGTNENGDVVAEFWFVWSVKAKG